jgi:hypothetical protein
MRHVVRSPDLDQRLPRRSAFPSLHDLMWRQLELATEPDPTRHRPLAPFVRPGLDQSSPGPTTRSARRFAFNASAGAGTYGIIAVDNSNKADTASGAVYKGLAIVTSPGGATFLYATNFRAGRDLEGVRAAGAGDLSSAPVRTQEPSQPVPVVVSGCSREKSSPKNPNEAMESSRPESPGVPKLAGALRSPRASAFCPNCPSRLS